VTGSVCHKRRRLNTAQLGVAAVASVGALAAVPAVANAAPVGFCGYYGLNGFNQPAPWACIGSHNLTNFKWVSGWMNFPPDHAVCAGVTDNDSFYAVRHVTSPSVKGYRCGTGVIRCSGGGGLDCGHLNGHAFVHNPTKSSGGYFSGSRSLY